MKGRSAGRSASRGNVTRGCSGVIDGIQEAQQFPLFVLPMTGENRQLVTGEPVEFEK